MLILNEWRIKFMRKLKVLISAFLCLALFFGITVHSYAAPAPSLTSITINDVTADEYDKVYIEIIEIGTSKNRYVYCNNSLLKENINEMVMIDRNRDGIVDGYRRYFYTGYSVSDISTGFSLDVRAQYTNAMRPWNTISARRLFTF